MLRAFVCSTLALALVFLAQAGAQQAQQGKTDQSAANKREHVTKAIVVSVDPAKNSIILKMKDKTGHEVERTIQLKGGLKVLNDKGESTRVDVFRRGNTMYVVERDERVFELRTTPEHRGSTTQKNGANPSR